MQKKPAALIIVALCCCLVAAQCAEAGSIKSKLKKAFGSCFGHICTDSSTPSPIVKGANAPHELVLKTTTTTTTPAPSDTTERPAVMEDEDKDNHHHQGEEEKHHDLEKHDDDHHEGQKNDNNSDNEEETMEIEPSEFAIADDDRTHDEDHEYPDEDKMMVRENKHSEEN